MGDNGNLKWAENDVGWCWNIKAYLLFLRETDLLMGILSRYVGIRFLRFLVLTWLVFLGLTFIGSLFGNLGVAFSSQTAFVNFLDRTMRGIPKMTEMVLPVSALLASVFTFSGLRRSAELVSFRAAGMSLSQMLFPLVIVLIPIAGIAYYSQNFLHPQLNPHDAQYTQKVIRHQWRSLPGSLYYFGAINPRNKRFSNILIYEWGQRPFRLLRLTQFRTGHYDEALETWVLESGSVRTHDGSQWRSAEMEQLVFPRERFPDVFRPEELNGHHIPIHQLIEEIRLKEELGQSSKNLWLEFFQKTASPFTLFLMMLIGVVLTQSGRARSRTSSEVVLSVLVGLSYWVTSEIAFVLAKGGGVSPFIGAWGINLLVLLLVLWPLYRVR